MHSYRWFIILCGGFVATLALCVVQLLRSMPSSQQASRPTVKFTVDPVVPAPNTAITPPVSQPASPPVSVPMPPPAAPPAAPATPPASPPDSSKTADKTPAPQPTPSPNPPAKDSAKAPAKSEPPPIQPQPKLPADPAPFKAGSTDVRVVTNFCSVPTTGVDFSAGIPIKLFSWKSAPASFQLRLHGPQASKKPAAVTAKSVARSVSAATVEDLLISFSASAPASTADFDAKVSVENGVFQYRWLRRPSDLTEAAKQLTAHVVEVRTTEGSWLFALSPFVVKPAIPLSKGEGLSELSRSPHWGNAGVEHRIAQGFLTLGPAKSDPSAPSKRYPLLVKGNSCRVPDLERDSGIDQVAVNLNTFKSASLETWKLEVAFSTDRQQRDLLAQRAADQKKLDDLEERKRNSASGDIRALIEQKNALLKIVKQNEEVLTSLRAASQSYRERVQSISLIAYIEVYDAENKIPIHVQHVCFGDIDSLKGAAK